jgi:signal transduction histidine kinase/ligand-binding sensor domain-containing protein
MGSRSLNAKLLSASCARNACLLFILLILTEGLNTLSALPLLSAPLPAFHHTSLENIGFGAVYDIQQDSQGYLWLQAANGIYRFDGVKFLSVDEVTHGVVRNSSGLDAVLPSATGGVWFMPHKSGLIFWKNGQIEKVSDGRCTGRLGEAPDGSLWIGGSYGVFHLKNLVCEEIGKKWGLDNGVPSGFLVDREGTVWIKKWSGELLFLRPGSSKFQLSPYGGGATTTLSSMGEAPDGSIWLADGHGLRQVYASNGRVVPVRPPGMNHAKQDQFGSFGFTKDGSIWIATNKGARWAPHPQQWATPDEMADTPGEDLTITQGLSSDVVWSILIDKEDTAWMATNSGLDQTRRTTFHPVKMTHVQEHEFGIATGGAESVWIGSESLPLTHVVGDKLTTYSAIRSITSLKEDRRGAIWAASKGENHLWQGSDGAFKKIAYPHEEKQSIVALAVDRQNSLWISMRQFGVFRLSNGVWTDENSGLGKPTSVYGGMTEDIDGNVWFAFRHNLVEWDGTRYIAFSLPEKTQGIYGSALAVANHHVWFPTSAGLEMFTNGNFRLLRLDDHALPGVISGIAETAKGDLWLNGFSGVLHISHEEMAKWFQTPNIAVSAEHLDTLDGLPGLSGETIPKPSLIASSAGRLWFATTKGVAWLDPVEFDQSRNLIPPPVVISTLVSNGIIHAAANSIELPAHIERLELHFDALSFAIPQRVLFKYKLEPLEKDWQDAGTRREAFYNSLAPGQYRFRVLACNNDGIWNEAGATMTFKVMPAYYQTQWFELLVILTLAGLIWLAWNLRMAMITRDLRGRLNARLEERERIARELHDTLLQGIFGLTLRLQTSADQLEEGHPVKADITQALNQSDVMMLKGRERIRGLREVSVSEGGLVASLGSHGRQLQSISMVQFQISEEGEARPLNSSIEEELSLIACEAITNAFRHSGASLIRLEIVFRWNSLQVRVTDNGKGVDPTILAAGERTNHYGLLNMRERADKMRAKFNIHSSKNTGTIVQIEIPGTIAFRAGLKLSDRLWPKFKLNKKSVETL